jgi:hypothetical protein
VIFLLEINITHVYDESHAAQARCTCAWMVVPRERRRVVFRSPRVERRPHGHPPVTSWNEYTVHARPREAGLVAHRSAAGVVRTDLEFAKNTWVSKGASGPKVLSQQRILKLTPVGSLTWAGPRVDLRLGLPVAACWGAKGVASRVFAWHFLNTGKLSWAEFNMPHPIRPKSFYWQVHHANKNPSATLADQLKIVKHTTNEKDLRGQVQKASAKAKAKARTTTPKAKARVKAKATLKAAAEARAKAKAQPKATAEAVAAAMPKPLPPPSTVRRRTVQGNSLASIAVAKCPRLDPVRQQRSLFWREFLLDSGRFQGPLLPVQLQRRGVASD